MRICLDGRTALVTGGSSGIGEACVRLLRQAGADVAFTFNRNRAHARRVAQDTGARALACEVTEEPACREAVAGAAGTAARLDILVNNAGVYESAAADSRSFLDVWRRVLAVNLDACARFIHLALPFMKEGGKIVNISSIHAADGSTNAAAYHASKAGLDGLTRALAVELAPRNIQVNSVAPGPVLTPMWGDPKSKYISEIARLIPARRFGKPEDIAGAVVFLASAQADYITGQTLFVDGGILINVYKE
jgi:NAD(P)-dependent dehydrogenase (short-subunit alcohol dehydrogenase family)